MNEPWWEDNAALLQPDVQALYKVVSLVLQPGEGGKVREWTPLALTSALHALHVRVMPPQRYGMQDR